MGGKREGVRGNVCRDRVNGCIIMERREICGEREGTYVLMKKRDANRDKGSA